MKRFSAILLIALCLATPAFAQRDDALRPVVTHPAEDEQPAVSPDGQWLVFVSSRDGAPGLYIQSIADGRPGMIRPLFPHPARTVSPVFSPDGKRLAFVSTRHEALGDVYIADFPDGEPRAVSMPGTSEENPWFAEDGSRLHFTSRTIEGKAAGFVLQVGDVNAQPAASNESPAMAEAPYPVRFLDATGGSALLHADDTNRDGILNGEDMASPWELVEGQWHQADRPYKRTSGISRDTRTGDIYVAADFDHGLDIAAIGSTALRTEKDPAALMRLARASLGRSRPDYDHAAACYRMAESRTSDVATRGEARLGLVRTMNRAARHAQAAMEVARSRASSFPPDVLRRLETELALARLYTVDPADMQTARELAVSLQSDEAYYTEQANLDAVAEIRLALADFNMRRRNHAEALAIINLLLDTKFQSLDASLLARAYIIRADIYTRTGLIPEARTSLFAVFEQGTVDNNLLDAAAQRLVASAVSDARNEQERLLAIRDLAARSEDHPYLLTRVWISEARSLIELDQVLEARSVYRQAARSISELPIPAVEAATELAALHWRQGETEETITTLRDIESTLQTTVETRDISPQTVDTYIQVRQDLVRYFLAKGRRELALGDPLLALNTFDRLIDFDPAITSAWRGRIKAVSTQPELLAKTIRECRKDAEGKKTSALDIYKYALALSYEQPSSRRAEKELRKAISLSPGTPHYFVTVGFILEEQYKDRKERGSADLAFIEEAAALYEQALSLTDRDVEPELYSDILLNIANVSLELGQNARAVAYYRLRSEAESPFDDLRTEFLFHWHFGQGAYRASVPSVAVEQFHAAEALLPELIRKKMITDEQGYGFRLELIGHRALAHMTAGDIDQSRELFERLYNEAPEGSLGRMRALRNQAVLLLQKAESQVGGNRLRSLASARVYALRAMDELGSVASFESAATPTGGGLIDLSISIASGPGPAADIDFDKQDEERLLHAVLARVATLEADPAESIRQRGLQLALDPQITDQNRAYFNAARTVVLDHLAADQARLGNYTDAADCAFESLGLGEFETGDQVIYNTNAASRALARLVEIGLRAPDPSVLRRPDAFWMLDSARSSDASEWTLLQAAAEALLAMKDPAIAETPTDLVSDASEKARLHLVSVLAAEQRIYDLMEKSPEGIAMIESAAQQTTLLAQLDTHAGLLSRLSSASTRPVEARRLDLLARAARLRLAQTMDDAETSRRMMEELLLFARETGQSHLDWWIVSQAALSCTEPQRRAELIARAQEGLFGQFVYTTGGEDLEPWGVLDALEKEQLSSAGDNHRDQWNIVEMWRTARLRWLSEDQEPATASNAEAEWLAGFHGDMAAYRRILLDLQSLASVNSSRRTRLLARLDEIEEKLAGAEAAGRQAGFGAVAALRPSAGNFAQVESILETEGILPAPAQFLLHRRIGDKTWSVVYTSSQTDGRAGNWDASADSILFLLGDDPGGLPGRSCRLVNTETLYRRLQEPVYRAPRPPIGYPAEEGETITRDLDLAYAVAIRSTVEARALRPELWIVESTGEALGDVFHRIREPIRGAMTVRNPSGTAESHRQLAMLALADWLESRGIYEAEINGQNWIAVPLDPRVLRSASMDFMQVLTARYVEAATAGDYEQATIHLEKLLNLADVLGERETLKNSYRQMVLLRNRLGQHDEAVRAATEWISLLDESGADALTMAGAWSELGLNASMSRYSEDLIDHGYEKAIALLREAGSGDDVFAAVRDYAIALENNGRFQEALDRIDEARRLVPGNAGREAQQDIRAARILRVYLSRYVDAEDRLVSARERATDAGIAALVFESWINLSRVHQATGRFEDALADLDQAEQWIGSPADPSLRAQVALERSNVAWFRSDYFQAFREQQTALEMAGKASDKPVIIAVHNVSGLTAWALNDYARAYGDLEEALRLAEEYGVEAEIATTCNNIGLVHRSEEKYNEALAWFQRALRIDERERNRWAQAYSLRNIGITLTAMGNPEDAIDPLERAVELTRIIGDRVNEAKALLALAEAQAALRRMSEAEGHYRSALELAGAVSIPEVQWRSHYGLARLAEARGNDGEALRLYENSISVVDRMRASIRIEEFQDGFLFDKQKVYEGLIELHLRRGDVAAALEASEKSRGRNFIDLLGNRRINLRSIEDEQLLARESELRLRVEDLERRVAAATTSDESIEQNRRLSRAREEYSDFLIRLRTESPELSSFIRVEPVTVAEMQALLDPATRLLIYHLLPEGPVCWVLGRDSLEFERLPGTTDELRGLVADTRVGIQNFEDIDDRLDQLAQTLIVPLMPRIEGASRIGVVPHRELHMLPFAALRFGPGDHLVDRYAIFYSPSASVLRYTQERRRTDADRNRVLAVGNPDRGTPLYDLPFAQKEAERLFFDFDDVTVRVGEEATESWLVDNLPNYGIIHIASHGEFRPDTPLFSAVLLAPDMQNDGTLTAEEIFSLRLRADLVALSACQSGLGRLSSGDDVVGLNRAFVYAGTRQIMTTLWRVDDVSTAILFKYFYRNVDDGDRAEALRRAQIRLKNRPEYRHPAHWSGLVLSGDWQ